MIPNLIPSFVNRLKTYTPGKQPSSGQSTVIKLNTNENPYTPACLTYFFKNYTPDLLRLYPDPHKTELTKTLSEHLNIPAEQIAWGNGSDELIAVIFRTFLLFADDLNSRKVILTEYTYGAYQYYAFQSKIPIETLKTNGLVINPEHLTKVSDSRGKVFFLTNPNAPTGRVIDPSTIKQVALDNPHKIIVVDEAYIDFCQPNKSSLSIIADCPNIIVLRTFSKSFSACGIRLGYAVGSVELINAIKKLLDPYNVNLVAQQVGCLLLNHHDEIKDNCDKVIVNRNQLISDLKKIGFKTLPSETNFILTEIAGLDAALQIDRTRNLFKYLEEQEILVRYFDEPTLNRYLRISIGTDDEMNRLVSAIKTFLKRC